MYTPVKRLLLLTEIIAVNIEYRVKHIITLCGESAERFSIRVGDTANSVTERLNSAMYGFGWKITR